MGRPIFEIGITELIGADDAEVGAQDYSKSVEVNLAPEDLVSDATQYVEKISGEILNFLLISSGGAILTPSGWIYIFDADPAIASGDTDITLAEQKTIIAKIKITSSDWDAGAVAASAEITVAKSFHGVSKMYLAFRTDAGSTAINSAGGDDEVFDFNFWYRRDDR